MRHAAFAVLAILGCSHQRVVAAPVRVTPHAAVRWNVRASSALRPLLETENEVLLLGSAGERWLVPRPLPKTLDAIQGVPAATLLPRHVVGAVRRGGAIVFVLLDGTRLRAATPLGDATEIAGPSAVRVLAVTDKAIVAFKDHAIVRSIDDGATWLPTKHPPIAGVAWYGAMTSDGRGLVVDERRAVLATDDRGLTWRVIAQPPTLGARVTVRNDQLYIESWLLEAGDTWRHDMSSDRCCEAVRVDRAPYGSENTEADRIDWGWAALTDRYVYDLKPSSDPEASEHDVEIERRPFGGNEAHVVAKVNCDEMSIAALGSTIEYLCVRGEHGLLRRSEDDGKTWFDDGAVRIPSADDPVVHAGVEGGAPLADRRVHLGADRALTVSTVCPESDVCSLPGVVRRAGSDVFERIRVNYRSPRFASARFAGKRVYAVGTVEGDGRVGAIFESIDGGLTFNHHTVRLEETSFPDNQYRPDRGELVVDGQGNLVRAVVIDGHRRWGTFERAGAKWLAMRTPGIPSFAWPRAFTGTAESNDGGKTWHGVLGAPERARCTPAGCLVGSNDRIGWELVASE